jgi:hypothetical protein
LEKTIRNLAYPEMIESQRNSEVPRRAILQRIGWGVATAALSPAARMYGGRGESGHDATQRLHERGPLSRIAGECNTRGSRRRGPGPYAPVLGMAPTTGLLEKILSLEKVKNIVELRPFLQRA